MTKNRMLAALGALALLLGLTACGADGAGQDTPGAPETPQATAPALRYTNGLFGYTLDMPEGWAGHYAAQEFAGEATVSSTDNGEFGGMLFTIEWAAGEDWHGAWQDGEDAPFSVRFLAEQDGLVLYARFPSDIQYDPGDAEKTEIYGKMRGETDAVLDTFARAGEAFPEIRTGGIIQAGEDEMVLEDGAGYPTAGNLTAYVNGEDVKSELTYDELRAQPGLYEGRTFQIFIKDGAVALLNEIQE